MENIRKTIGRTQKFLHGHMPGQVTYFEFELNVEKSIPLN